MRILMLLSILSILFIVSPAGSQIPMFLHEWGEMGTGPGQFEIIEGVAVDMNGFVYVADRSDRIQKFDVFGGYHAEWPVPYSPFDVAVDLNGDLLAVMSIGEIYRFSTSGALLDSWFAGGPYCIDVHPDGRLFIATADLPAGYRIHDASGGLLDYWDSHGSGPGQFNNPYGAAFDSQGNIYVADRGNNRVQRFDASRNFILEWGSLGAGPGQFDYPSDVAVDSQDRVYVADSNNNRIQIFDGQGAYQGEFGGQGAGPGQFQFPSCLCIGPGDYVYVADVVNRRIQLFGDAAVTAKPTTWSAIKTGAARN